MMSPGKVPMGFEQYTPRVPVLPTPQPEPYPTVAPQAAPKQYGFWEGIKQQVVGDVPGAFAKNFQEAQQRVQEAGQGKYRPIESLEDVFYNIGQFGGPLGKVQTATFESGKMVGKGLLHGLSVPAATVERALGEFSPVGQQMREEFGVTGDPLKEKAFATATAVSWSGPEAVRRAYQDAYDLAQKGQLDDSNATLVQARHGVWWKEILGQTVADPLNLIGSAPAKIFNSTTKALRAEKLFVQPMVKAGEALGKLDDFGKVLDKIAPTSEVVDRLKKSSTVWGQFKEAEGLHDTLGAVFSPRVKDAVIHRTTERVQQVATNIFAQAQKHALDEVAAKGLTPGTPEFAAELNKTSGLNLQRMAVEWAKLGSDNVDEVKEAALNLRKAGFGNVPVSPYGRYTGVVMRKLMQTPTGEMGDLITILQKGKEQGLSAEHVAEAWYRKADRVLNSLIETPGWEKTPLKTVPQAITKKLAPFHSFLAKMFMGMSLGFPARNLAGNVTKMAIDGWSPFHVFDNALYKRLGFDIIGAERGIGPSEEEAAKLGLTTFGLWAGQKIEKLNSLQVADQAFQDAIRRLWPKALGTIKAPEVADPSLQRSLQRAVERAIWNGADALDQLERELVDALSSRGVGGAAPVPPAAQPASRLIESWRFPSKTLTEELQKAGGNLWTKVEDILDDAATPEEAITRVRELQKTFAEHVAKMAYEVPPIHHAAGTATGEAVQQAVRSGKVGLKSVQELSETLGQLEQDLRILRGKALHSATMSIDPGEWSRVLDDVEERYVQSLDALRREQSLLYAQLVYGSIDEGEYAREVINRYSQVKNFLAKEYRRVIRDAGVPKVGSPEEARLYILRRELQKEARAAGVFSATDKGVPNPHFTNAIKKALGLEAAPRLNDMTPEQLEQAINHFRDLNELPPTTYDELYAKYVKQPPGPEKVRLPATLPTTPPDFSSYGGKIPPDQVEMWKGIYNIDDAGQPIYETVQETLDNSRFPESFQSVAFQRDRKTGQILANRSQAHVPGDQIMHGNFGEDGKLRLFLLNDEPAKLKKYAQDLIKSGLDPETLIVGPTAIEVKGLSLPASIDELANLGVKEAAEVAWYTNELGERVYVFLPGKSGEINPQEYFNYLQDAWNKLGKNTDPEIALALAAVKATLDGAAPKLTHSPSAADAAYYGSSEFMRLLDNLADQIDTFAKQPPTSPTPAEILPQEWAKFFEDLRGLHTQTHLTAAEIARRARDVTLLDYSDRRLHDLWLKTAFPWAYWHTRSIPNWAAGLMMNPSMLAHYMNYKREMREYNDNDPTIPEWARDDIVIQPPGWNDKLYLDLEATFNPIQTIFDNFEDEDAQRDAFGRVIADLGKAGPAPTPLLMMVYAAERWAQGDNEGARTLGYFSPLSRAFSATTGVTLEPWLWLTDPATGRRQPFVGGTKWDLAKATRRLGFMQGVGTVSPEAATYGAATQSGKSFETALQDVLEYRRVPVLASILLGLKVTPQADWEQSIVAANQEWNDAKALGDEAKQEVLNKYPWMTTVWFSNANEIERMASLAKNVLGRIPPGTPSEQLLERAGISPAMKDSFNWQQDDGGLSEWDDLDYQQFTRGILNLAEILKIPDAKTAQEWKQAKEAYGQVWNEINRRMPDYQDRVNLYMRIKEVQGDEAANQYGQESGLFEIWDMKRQALMENPLLAKYYADPSDVDQAAESLMHEEAERRWPGIHDIQDQYYQIPEEDKRGRREFRIQHPELREYWSWQDKALKDLRTQLADERSIAGTGDAAPDYVIDGKPNLSQRAVLDTIKEMELDQLIELRTPPPIDDPSNIPQEVIEKSERLDKFYSNVLQEHPDFFTQERVYERIKQIYGQESANLFAKRVGLFDAWNKVKLQKAFDPLFLKDMSNEELESTATAMMYDEMGRRFPGVDETWNQYYSLPKKERRKFWAEHPELQEASNFKKTAKQLFYNNLLERRKNAMSPQQDLTNIREAIGQAESGGDYSAQNSQSSASGKYQYIDSSWNNYGGYTRAKDAPPEIQDQKALEDIQQRYQEYGGDIEKVIASHFYPAWANDKSKWNTPVHGQATIRQYVNNVLSNLQGGK